MTRIFINIIPRHSGLLASLFIITNGLVEALPSKIRDIYYPTVPWMIVLAINIKNSINK